MAAVCDVDLMFVGEKERIFVNRGGAYGAAVENRMRRMCMSGRKVEWVKRSVATPPFFPQLVGLRFA